MSLYTHYRGAADFKTFLLRDDIVFQKDTAFLLFSPLLVLCTSSTLSRVSLCRTSWEGEAGDRCYVQAGSWWKRQGEAEKGTALPVWDPGPPVWLEGRLPAQQHSPHQVQSKIFTSKVNPVNIWRSSCKEFNKFSVQLTTIKWVIAGPEISMLRRWDCVMSLNSCLGSKCCCRPRRKFWPSRRRRTMLWGWGQTCPSHCSQRRRRTRNWQLYSPTRPPTVSNTHFG